MQLHQLKPTKGKKTAKRIGRGGKRGTYSGRGAKGQKSRSGSGGKNIVEKGRSSWVKRLPKLGGFKSVYLRNITVTIESLEKHFDAEAEVSPISLMAVGLAPKDKRGKSGRNRLIKILDGGSLTKKITIRGCLISKKAEEVVQKAGGKIIEVPKRNYRETKEKRS